VTNPLESLKQQRQIVEGRASRDRLDRAVEYVSDYWIPANPALLKKLQGGIAQGEYDKAASLLVSEIRSDFSLFLYCIKELVTTMRASGAEFVQPLSPVELLRNAGLDQLKKILSVDDSQVSFHALTNGNEMQLARFREVMISATTAEVISEECNLDPDAAYCTAFMRQLGYVLIAWNYPGLYGDALASVRAGENLDVVLTSRLGFSPQMLATRVLHSWGLGPDACEPFALHDEDDEEVALIDSLGARLGRICKVGEALARANDPERYPSAREDWAYAKKEIEEHLGERGMALVRERCLENIENYLTYLPEAFDGTFILDDAVSGHEQVEATGKNNPYIQLCQPQVGREIRSFYLNFKGEKMSRDNICLLVKDTIPSIGYTGGYVYLVDPGLMKLMPLLQIGHPQLRTPDPVEYSVARSDSDIISIAYHQHDPAMIFKRSPAGRLFNAIAGAFGDSEKLGVVYLEMPRSLSPGPEIELLHFKAIAWALSDCFR
jgi:hypothetical protein